MQGEHFMPVKELKEPIWERQEGETPNQHDWFNEFLDYSGYSLKAFHESLEKQQESAEVNNEYDKIPTLNMINKWSSNNKWMSRKKAYRDFEKEEEREELRKIKRKHKISNFEKKQSIQNQLLDEILLGLTVDKPFSQINQGIQGYATIAEDDRKDLGEDDTTLKMEAKVNATTEVKSESSIELIFEEAYQNLIDDTIKNSTHLKNEE